LAKLEFGEEDLAKYPFLKEVGELIKKFNLRLDEILQQEDYLPALERAKNRVLESVGIDKINTEIDNVDIEILSFPLSLMLVKATNLDHLISRYCLGESLRIEKLLESENKNLIPYFFKNAFEIELFKLKNSEGINFDFKIKTKDYLERATQFHKSEWKLINRVVDKGFVHLKTHEMIRLIREEIRKTIYIKIKKLSIPKLPENVQKLVDEIIKTTESIPKMQRFKFVPKDFPPCIKYVSDILQKGQNVPHYGRFLLTSYFLGIGKTVDDIMNMYPKSPDYNERVSRYHVEHIAGMRGGRVQYQVPSCRTLMTHGLCFRDVSCDEIKHPLNFGRHKFEKKSRS
jgi:DNA primase large subunit